MKTQFELGKEYCVRLQKTGIAGSRRAKVISINEHTITIVIIREGMDDEYDVYNVIRFDGHELGIGNGVFITSL